MEKHLVAGLRLFRIICNNIIKNPKEPKYRTINRANAKIGSTLFGLKGNVDLFVTTAGFIQTYPNNDTFVYENTPGGDLTALAKRCEHIVAEKMKNLEMLTAMKDSDRQKYEDRNVEVAREKAIAKAAKDEAERVLQN